MIKWTQIKMKPGYKPVDIERKIEAAFHLEKKDYSNIEILRESIDARKKPLIFYTLSAAFEVEDEQGFLNRWKKNKDISAYERKTFILPKITTIPSKRVVVIGAGPAGLFSCYYLAKAGLKPLLIERGSDVDRRKADVEKFWRDGVLNPESNVQFGEGGAGTFSDGKLNTLNKDPFGYQQEVLRLFVRMGAKPSIQYEQLPHVGTDILSKIVKNIRCEIEKMGGEVYFDTKVTDFQVSDGKIDKLRLEGVHDGWMPVSTVVLAIGHSARDTFELLEQRHFSMEAKEFAVGYRVMHEQKFISESQYGAQNVDKMPPSPYKLTATAKNGRGVYSFCMCPGGYVVNSSSQEGRLCINGMSYSKRDGVNANSAIIISVNKNDFPDRGALSGMYFQQELEERAFSLANGNIPLQRLEDYQKNQASTACGKIVPACKGTTSYTNLRGLLPEALEEAFLDGMAQFERKIPGFCGKDTLVAALEGRTSSPIRIHRDEKLMAVGIQGIYPCGEGAGYAGGITSAAMDGIKVAMAVLRSLGGE